MLADLVKDPAARMRAYGKCSAAEEAEQYSEAGSSGSSGRKTWRWRVPGAES